MELFDSHFHFYGEATPAEYMQQIRQHLAVPPQSDFGKVSRLYLLACGGDFIESCRAMEFAGMTEDCFFAAGVHPHQAGEYLTARQDFSVFEHHPKLAAIGELGLDYFYGHSGRTDQQQVLEEFLDIALRWGRPAVIHLRDREDSDQAYRDAAPALEAFSRAGGSFAVHCFAGTPAWAERFLAMGAFCGVTGMVTFRRAENIRELLHVIPQERLLIETDSPYLAPVPHRGGENIPAYVILVAARIAAELGISISEAAAVTTANARRFLKLSAS